MAAFPNVLIGFSLICLLLGGVWGWVTPGAPLWKIADPIYYPLAMLGVIFLFVNNQGIREQNDLRVEKMEAEQRKQLFVASRPSVAPVKLTAETFADNYRLLMRQSELGKSCTYSPSYACVAPRRQAKILDELFVGFDASPTSKDAVSFGFQIVNYCGRVRRLIDTLANQDELVNDVFARLRALLSSLADVSPSEQRAAANKSFEAFVTANKAELSLQLEGLSEDRRQIYQPVYESSASFAEILHLVSSPCVEISKERADQYAELQNWTKKQAEYDRVPLDIERKIDAAKKEKELSPSDVYFLQIYGHAWPYILVFALTIKFAKGVSGLRGAPKPVKPPSNP